MGRALKMGLISIVGNAERDGKGGRDGKADSDGLIGCGVIVGQASILHISAGAPCEMHSRITARHSGFTGSQH